MNHRAVFVGQAAVLAAASVPIAPHARAADLSYDSPVHHADFTIGNATNSPSISFAGSTQVQNDPAPVLQGFDAFGDPNNGSPYMRVTRASGGGKSADATFSLDGANDPSYGNDTGAEINPAPSGSPTDAPADHFTVTSQAIVQIAAGAPAANSLSSGDVLTLSADPFQGMVSQRVTFHLAAGAPSYTFTLHNLLTFVADSTADPAQLVCTTSGTGQFAVDGAAPQDIAAGGAGTTFTLNGGQTLDLFTGAAEKLTGQLVLTAGNFSTVDKYFFTSQIAADYSAAPAVPEPATLLIFAPALAGLLRRRPRVAR